MQGLFDVQKLGGNQLRFGQRIKLINVVQACDAGNQDPAEDLLRLGDLLGKRLISLGELAQITERQRQAHILALIALERG